MNLELIKEALSTGEMLPKSYYEAKKYMRDLGLGSWQRSYTCMHIKLIVQNMVSRDINLMYVTVRRFLKKFCSIFR